MHALVKFLEDGQPMCVVPTKQINNSLVNTLKEKSTCEVQWSDGAMYKAEVLNIGNFTCSVSNRKVMACRVYVIILGDENTMKKSEKQLAKEEEDCVEKPPKRPWKTKQVHVYMCTMISTV